MVRTRPVLSAGFAWALLDAGELEASEIRLLDAESCLNGPAEKMVVSDMAQFRSLPASIATARAYHALAMGAVPATVKYARLALDLTPHDDPVRYMQATSLMGLTQYAGGDLVAAERSLTDFHANLNKMDEFNTLFGITFLLADIRIALGRLTEAESLYRQSLKLATDQGETPPPGTADLYRGLGELCVKHVDLVTAAHYLLTSQKLGELTTLADWMYRLCISQARLKEAQSDLDGALALLDEAARVHIRSPLPDIRPVAALKVRLWLKQGCLSEALGWVRQPGLAVDDEILYNREFEYISLARVLIAAGKTERQSPDLDEALRLLQRLLATAESGARTGSVIQILILQALAFQVQMNLEAAHASLKRALALAAPQSYIGAFMDEGPELAQLLEKPTPKRGQLLSAFEEKLLAALTQPLAQPQSEPRLTKSNLIEPLSERELEVLRLLRSELSGPQMARELIVSLNTLRTHTKSIFTKLGVNNRRAAVRRAAELHIF
jgi:LuxR family transcriptional regulator, maltose regulon positive regulatory protein